MNLNSFKEQFPQYSGIPDEELSARIYGKFYAGKMDRSEFDARMNRRGLPSSFQKLETPPAKSLGDQAVGAVKDYFVNSFTGPIKKVMAPLYGGPQPLPEDFLSATALGMGAGWKGGLPAGETGVGMGTRDILKNRSLKRIEEMRGLATPEDYLPPKPLPDLGEIPAGGPIKGKRQTDISEAPSPFADYLRESPRSGTILQESLTPTEAAFLQEKKDLAAVSKFDWGKSKSKEYAPITPDISFAEALRRAGGVTDPAWFGKAEFSEYSKLMPGVLKQKGGHTLAELDEVLEAWAGRRMGEDEIADLMQKEIARVSRRQQGKDVARRTGNVEDDLEREYVEEMKRQRKAQAYKRRDEILYGLSKKDDDIPF